MSSLNPFESLPLELVYHILVQLKPAEICRLTSVCRYFAILCRDWNVWAEKAWHDFDLPRHVFLNPRPYWNQHIPYRCYRNAKRYRYPTEGHLKRFASDGDTEMIRYLFYRNSHLKLKLKLKLNEAIGYAAYYNHVDAVLTLIQAGETNLWYAMTEAIRGGHLEMLKILVEHGAHYDSYQLYVAAIHNQLEILRYLMQSGVIPYDQALIGASQYGHFEIVRALIESAEPPRNYVNYARTINWAFNETNGRGYDKIMHYLWPIRQQVGFILV